MARNLEREAFLSLTRWPGRLTAQEAGWALGFSRPIFSNWKNPASLNRSASPPTTKSASSPRFLVPPWLIIQIFRRDSESPMQFSFPKKSFDDKPETYAFFWARKTICQPNPAFSFSRSIFA